MDFQHDVLDERPPKRWRVETSDTMENFTNSGEALKMTEDTAVIGGASTTDPPREKKGKEKGRRNRRATSYHREKGLEGSERPAGPKAPRRPKRQCALLIGFCGSGYNGMQMYVASQWRFKY